ncbi:MAG: hypothetical protein CME20_16790 [Gemmatimonadetes bacterium]|nr:hypothetical protein [Gemmatimonadota bacterium]
MGTADTPAVAAGCDDTYLIDYLFELNGYLIIKGAVSAADLAAMNAWADAHAHYVDQPLRGGRDGHSDGAWIGYVETHTYSDADGLNFQNIIEAGPVFERHIDHPAWIDHIRRWINADNGLSLHETLLNLRGPGGYIGIHCGGHIPCSYMTFRQANTGEWMVGQINCITAMQDMGPGDGAPTLIPGSHKAAIPHPRLAGESRVYRSDEAAGTAVGMRELYMEAGDILLFTDTITHGSAARSNEGYRRMLLYRYSPRWIRTRFNYDPSPELLARLSAERRKIVDPIPLRRPTPGNV